MLCLADQAAQEEEPSEEAADEDATPEKEIEKGNASAESPPDALARAAGSVDSEAAAKGAAAKPSEEAAEGAPEASGKDAAAANAADTGVTFVMCKQESLRQYAGPDMQGFVCLAHVTIGLVNLRRHIQQQSYRHIIAPIISACVSYVSLHAGDAQEHIDRNPLLRFRACSRHNLQVVSLLDQVMKCTHRCK